MTSRPRIGIFAEYGGWDCRIFRRGNDLCVERLDRNALGEGFVEGYPDRFHKIVSRAELGQIFSVTPFAVYRGVEFPVMAVNERKDVLTIVANDTNIAKRLDMVLIDRETYALNITFDEIESYREVREPRENF